jgi:hypothetical protein
VIARVAAELERAAAQHAPHATSHHRP